MAEVAEYFTAHRNGASADCSLAELGVKTGVCFDPIPFLHCLRSQLLHVNADSNALER